MIVVCLSSTCAHINFDISCKINRTPSTCDLSSCHQHVPGIFHGRTDPVTNDEVLELMASQNSQHLSSSVQVRRVSCNVSFLISTKNLSSSDAAVDAMGVWKLSKSKRKNCRGQMVRRRTYRNKAWKDLVKAFVEPEEFPYVFIQYRFEGEPCSFDLLPHGNSKGNQLPYVRVNPSTMQLLKEETDDVASARKAFHNVEKKVGGLTGASAVSQLPRNTKQVYNVKNMKAKSMVTIREDPLFRSLNSMEMEDDDQRFHQQFIKTTGTATHLLFKRRQVNDKKLLHNFWQEFGSFCRHNL